MGVARRHKRRTSRGGDKETSAIAAREWSRSITVTYRRTDGKLDRKGVTSLTARRHLKTPLMGLCKNFMANGDNY